MVTMDVLRQRIPRQIFHRETPFSLIVLETGSHDSKLYAKLCSVTINQQKIESRRAKGISWDYPYMNA